MQQDLQRAIYPLLAPLSRPIILHQLRDQQKLLVEGDVSAYTPSTTAWDLLMQKINEARPEVYTLMDPFVKREHNRFPRQQRFSTAWLLHQLSQFSPARQPITPATLSHWRKRGLMRESKRGLPNHDDAAAILLARLIDQRQRNWLPATVGSDEPRWWCWMQQMPDGPIVSCPYPLPEDLPPSALCWTPWAGAAWDPRWLLVGTGRGAIRWVGAREVEGRAMWAVSMQDLLLWDPRVARLDVPVGQPISQDAEQDIQQTIATLVLQTLALARFGTERKPGS